MKKMLILATVLPVVALAQQAPQQIDTWQPLRYFVGQWQGDGQGIGGKSTLLREYRFVLGEQFLEMKNKAKFVPTEKQPKGENHEDWGMFSSDNIGKRLVFRQFHLEGFVNQYVVSAPTDNPKEIRMESEAIENLPAGFRARLICTILNDNEFEEVFELASPGQEFKACAKNHFRRAP